MGNNWLDPYASIRRIADLSVVADNFRQGISATGYSIGIDLDNEGGFYPHDPNARGLIIQGMSATLFKTQPGASWSVIAGAVLRIDATDADVAWFEFLSLHAESSVTDVAKKQAGNYPLSLDITVVAGALPKIAAGFIEAGIVAVNTGLTLPDVEGIGRTPAVGDLIVRVQQNAGGGSVDLHASVWYRGVS